MKAVIPLVDIGGRHELSSPWNTASCTARCWGLGGSLSPVVCPLVGPISLHCCQRSVQEHLDCTRLRATGSHFRRLMLTQWKPMETSGWGVRAVLPIQLLLSCSLWFTFPHRFSYSRFVIILLNGFPFVSKL